MQLETLYIEGVSFTLFTLINSHLLIILRSKCVKILSNQLFDYYNTLEAQIQHLCQFSELGSASRRLVTK